MTDDLDTLRPEVREDFESFDELVNDGYQRPMGFDKHWSALRAELLRLQSTESRANEWQLRAERAEAELAALKARAQWQPIETAPHDGNRVLLWNRDWAAPFAGQFYGEAAGGWRLDYRIAPFTHQPTHWMPLPPALAEQGEG